MSKKLLSAKGALRSLIADLASKYNVNSRIKTTVSASKIWQQVYGIGASHAHCSSARNHGCLIRPLSAEECKAMHSCHAWEDNPMDDSVALEWRKDLDQALKQMKEQWTIRQAQLRLSRTFGHRGGNTLQCWHAR